MQSQQIGSLSESTIKGKESISFVGTPEMLLGTKCQKSFRIDNFVIVCNYRHS